MEQIEIGIIGSPPLQIQHGFPAQHKSRKLHNTICYHVKVDKDEYILFQLLQIGPYLCCYSEYLFHSSKKMYCKMNAGGVEFHTMITGRVMYKMNRDVNWILTSGGTYNILVNPPKHTETIFVSNQTKTFDIHVEEPYFIGLMEKYPIFKKLRPAIDSGDMDILYPDIEESDLSLRVQVNTIIRRLTETPTPNQQDATEVQEQLDTIITSFGSSDQSKVGGSDNIAPQLIDTLMDIRIFLKENYLDSKAVAAAEKKYNLSPKKLSKNFEILYGQKPKEFLLAEQIKRVQHFIKGHPTATRQEITMASGYLDAKHFYALFKNYTGTSINDYRQQILDQQVNLEEEGLQE